MKKCAKCLKMVDVDNFVASKKTRDGKASYCKPCQSDYYKAYNASRKAAKASVVHQSKTCPDCGLDKPISQFGKKSTSLDKHNLYCKICWKAKVYKSMNYRPKNG
jgi:RNase P subunit RPR2